MAREREDSGLSVKAFCEKAGIATKTYYYRLRRLREAAIKQTQSAYRGGFVLCQGLIIERLLNRVRKHRRNISVPTVSFAE